MKFTCPMLLPFAALMLGSPAFAGKNDTAKAAAAKHASSPALAAEPTTIPLPEYDRESAQYKTAYEISKLSMPEDSMLDFIGQQGLSMIKGMFAAAPEFRDIETEFPGFSDHLAGSLINYMANKYALSMPYLWDETAIVYAENFTQDELNELLAFYKSSVGQKLLVFAFKNIELDGAAFVDGTDTGKEPTAGDTIKLSSGKAMAFAMTLSRDEQDDLIKFVSSPLGKKAQNLRDKLFSNGMANAGGIFPQSEIEQVVIASATEFFMMQDAKEQ